MTLVVLTVAVPPARFTEPAIGAVPTVQTLNNESLVTLRFPTKTVLFATPTKARILHHTGIYGIFEAVRIAGLIE